MSISLIWAQAHNRVIGAEGTIPWRLPEDLALFKRMTMGHTVLMGRATWDSLPATVQPLPGRRNVVITRDRSWTAPGAEVAHSPEEAASRHPDAWVIGGAAIYTEMLPYATRVMCTLIDITVEGDTFAPELGDDWKRRVRSPSDGWDTSRTGLRYAVCDVWREWAS